jgi:DNA invertase Pin-like site-specific DNA recombinase
LRDLQNIVHDLRGGLKTAEPSIAAGKRFLYTLDVFAEFERRESQMEGIARAKANGCQGARNRPGESLPAVGIQGD